MKTKFTNKTSVELASPFDELGEVPKDASRLPQYVASLTQTVLRYHPSIKVEVQLKIDGSEYEIEVVMS